MYYRLEKTKMEDLDTVLNIYANARIFMKENGNPNQWKDNWPSKEKIVEDINKEISYKVTFNNKIIGVFAFVIGIDPTYLKIDGSWISNKEYGTIHRLASSFEYKGVFMFIQKELEKNNINFRIDTHEDNKIMVHQILKAGYKYCGIITPIEGGERLAFEKVII